MVDLSELVVSSVATVLLLMLLFLSIIHIWRIRVKKKALRKRRFGAQATIDEPQRCDDGLMNTRTLIRSTPLGLCVYFHSSFGSSFGVGSFCVL